jgi:prepilin-type N-terminal cleavage/methylation domain-containing protein
MARRPKVSPRACKRSLQGLSSEDHGYTLIEVMAAMLVLLVGALGTVQMFEGASAATGRTRAREGGTNVTREVIEAIRSVSYPKVVDTSLATELQSQPGLEDDSAAGGWQLRRRNLTYTIDVSVCMVDDNKDGLGVHDSDAFCGAPGGTVDLNPDDYKRVKVSVSWTGGGPTGRMAQSTVIENPGSAAGPAVKTLAMTSPSSSPITTPFTSVRFDATTSASAVTVSWLVDGTVEGVANGSGSAWSFNWPISQLYDGTYLVSAKAYDQYGAPGASKVVTIDLNRYAPLAPPGFTGGWNGPFVEFEWLPNAEGDIEGYRLYRQDATGSKLICGLSTDTTCRDSNPLNQPSTDYFVVAVDRDPSGNLREGARSTKTVVQGNSPPNPPTGLTATTDQYGHVVLNWNAPQPADPDSGDSIDFYRVYRDGNALADRYDRTGPGELSFIDTGKGGSTHEYWISAVDNHYAESTLVGPVSQ